MHLRACVVMQLAGAARPRVPHCVEDASDTDGDEVDGQQHAVDPGDARLLCRLPAAWREAGEPPQDVRPVQAVRRAPEAIMHMLCAFYAHAMHMPCTICSVHAVCRSSA